MCGRISSNTSVKRCRLSGLPTFSASFSALIARRREVFRSSSSSSAPRYQRLDGVEHVLRRPDTYVGSVAPAPALQWVLRDDGGGALERREVTASPALLKIVDEILVNAADNKQRDAATIAHRRCT